MLKRIIKIISVCLAFLAIPLSLFIGELVLPPQFGKTYYGPLPKMYARLKNTEGNRLVFVGASALAFGLNGELIEGELPEYTVCPFGLYGAIGTKAMMDLTRSSIREGDIVVLAPEQGAQSLSLYFSGEQLWKGIDGNLEMLVDVRFENFADMLGGFPKYISEKYAAFASGTELKPDGIYTADAFDENCNMVCERDYNRMPGGYDKADLISYETSVVAPDFIDYINEYNAFVESKGATLLYGFTPVNASGVQPQTQMETVDVFYDYLEEKLDCDILGNPHDYVLESGWFYDSNVHLNSAGSVVYSRQLVNDLKLFLKDTSETRIELPEMPEVPEEDTGEVGEDGKDAAMFVYAESGKNLVIVGLTDEGRTKTSLELPEYYGGKRVVGFTAQAFAGNTVIESLYISRYIRELEPYAFDGCTKLTAIYMSEQSAAENCRIAKYTFEGLGRFTIYVPESQVNSYLYDYFWRNVGDKIEGY